MLTLLKLPVEIRLHVYDTYLALHQVVHHDQQPSNEHIRTLRTCKQIYHEALPIFCRYISLRIERQIRAFLSCTGVIEPSQVLRADVANDGRFLHTGKDDFYPLSHLYLAMRMLPSVQHLRVFNCRQGLPITIESLRTRRISLQFEEAIFVACDHRPPLRSYELFVTPHTRANPFSLIAADDVRRLRLSGDCHIPAKVKDMPCLRHLTLSGITSNLFDRNDLAHCFPSANLDEFSYTTGAKDGLILRDHHLRSVAFGIGRNLYKLVLLGCSRLSSICFTECISALHNLHYLAVSIITVDEINANFVMLLPRTIATFKLSISNAGYTVPFMNQERQICHTVETDVFYRRPSLEFIAVDFREELMDYEGRRKRWTAICQEQRVPLYIGNWMENEVV